MYTRYLDSAGGIIGAALVRIPDAVCGDPSIIGTYNLTGPAATEAMAGLGKHEQALSGWWAEC
jgi:hypothetical protein